MTNLGRFFVLPAAMALAAVAPCALALAQAPAAQPAAGTPIALTDTAWTSARSGQNDQALAALKALPANATDPAVVSLRADVNRLEQHIAQRETLRTTEIAKASKELKELLAAEPTSLNLSKALKAAVTLHMLTPAADKPAVLASPDFKTLIERAEAGAKKAEDNGEWIAASELFGRLHLLLEDDGRYKADSRRMGDRLAMIRLYVPARLWELRNARRLEEKLSALPAFNDAGEDYNAKLKGISRDVLLQALMLASSRHVEKITMPKLLAGGLTTIRTMATTKDLEAAIPGLKNAEARTEFVAWIDKKLADVALMAPKPSETAVSNLVNDLIAESAKTVQIPEEALIHEFGNGAFDKLDEFSQIVWPDELARFKRIMEPSFVGVGVQIQMDEETQLIKVVNPLEGTPAFRAGIKAGDLIKKINETSALGMTLDQAVEQITGKANTKVTLTLEREGEDVVFPLVRAKIPIYTVRGWKRNGAKETDWDWFIDPKDKIAYVRMSGFNNTTTKEFLDAIDQAKAQSAKGLIFDLRFNPGGLLTQAVSVANLFIAEGTIVYTQNGTGPDARRQQVNRAEPLAARLKDMPVVVLINTGSASASEIVSGAIRYYADQGKVNAVVLGDRSFGKGSVQNVMDLSDNTEMKLTTQYYFLPSGTCVHRRPGAKDWGVQPHLTVEMLPEQITDALLLRQDADVPGGRPKTKKKDPEKKSVLDGPNDPDRLLNEGIDLQLETALLLLKSQTVNQSLQAQAAPVRNPGGG
ncbi:MAG: S41 family peptidase [Phycisphaerales bacterium]